VKRLLVLLSIFFYVSISSLHAQYDSVYLTRDMYENQIVELRVKYGSGKLIPEEYELPVLVALAHYPELNDINIEFVTAPIQSTMMAQPRSKTMFKGKKNRTYLIFINSCRENTGFLPSELSFNQLVGVLGHELGHICYYSGCTTIDLLVDGFGYYFTDYRRDFEAGTDMLAVDHGLGWQLLDFTDFIMNKAKLSEQYEKKKQKIYLTEKDIYHELLKRRQQSTLHNNSQ
jgi:hypothetical protein